MKNKNKPKYTFKDLVSKMVAHDVINLSGNE
jgi:hypothetical protein